MSYLGLTIETYDQDTAYKIGVMITQEIQKELSGSRSGRWYPTPGNPFYDATIQKTAQKPNKTYNYYLKYIGTTNRADIIGAAYRASAPGEAPTSRTGRLRQSFFMEVRMQKNNLWKVDIRTNVFYADDLETGTIKVAPRPYISTVMNKLAAKINQMKVASLLKIMREI